MIRYYTVSLLLLLSLVLLICQAKIQTTQDDDAKHYFYFASYGNQSFSRFYGLIYETRGSNLLNKIIDVIDDDIVDRLRNDALNDSERENLESVLEPFLRWDLQGGEDVTVRLQAENRDVILPDDTEQDGRYDEFVALSNPNDTVVYYTGVKPVDTSAGTGNITITTTEWGVISDVDDVLRIAEIWDADRLLRLTFLEPFTPVPGMQQLFDILDRNLSRPSYHYATTAVTLFGPVYSEFLLSNYQLGSVDMRPIDVTDLDEVLNARKDQVIRLRETFPTRKFFFFSDMSNKNAIVAFSDLARSNPSNVACIFLRNITATYPDFSTTVNLQEEFSGVENAKWFVFDNPSDLYNVNFAAGSCRPPGIPDNQTTISGGFGGTDAEPREESSSVRWSFSMILVSAMLVLSIVAMHL